MLRRRIYRDLLALAALSVVVLTTLLCLYFYDAFKRDAFAEVRQEAHALAGVLDGYAGLGQEGPSPDRLFTFIGDDRDAMRVTLMAPDGEVLFDNQVPASSLEGHADRSEFKAAQATGAGEALRFSDTQLSETYYYAVRLADGRVLRLSTSVKSVGGVFLSLLPSVALVAVAVLLLANLLSRRLTRGIIEPLSAIDLDGDNLAVYDELIPYAKKIDQQRAEIAEQLAGLESRADTINAITSNMREGLILLDAAGKVLTANQSALDVFGADGAAVLGTDIIYVCREPDFLAGVKRCLAGEAGELSWQRGQSSFDIYFSPVLSGFGIIGGVLLFLDTTERQAAERQRREFTANVSHELKTPLTSISALAEMIRNGMADRADIPGFAERIGTQAGRLMTLIDDIIKLSEFDEGQAEADLTTFDLRELAWQAIDAQRPAADAKGVTLRLLSEPLPVRADRQMLGELLNNLVDNAIKYNREDGEVTVTLGRDAGQVRIAVADTGVGIAPEHQGRVFERFYRVDPSRSKQTGGTGLGLAIVRHIVEHHGGRIELSSDLGQGTTVTCYLAG